MTYAQWDAVADAFNPLLMVASCIFLMFRVRRSQQHWATGLQHTLYLFGAMLWVYGWLWLDSELGLWAARDLDYSTHTAFAVALTAYLCAAQRPWPAVWLVLLAAYCGLMWYQAYHTPADMLTTALVTLLGVALLRFRLRL